MAISRIWLRRVILVSLMVLIPVALEASSCRKLFDELEGGCWMAIDFALCVYNAGIAYCNCMGWQCV